MTKNFNVTGTLESTLKTVKTMPDGITVHGLIREDGTGLESITKIDSKLSAIMTDEVWVDLKNADVIYQSSDSNIAAVDANGIVTSGVTEGIATITASVTVNGITKSDSYTVVNELKIRPSMEEIAAAKANLKTAYDKLPRQAYSESNLAKIDDIYNNAVSALDAVTTKDDLSTTLAKAINDLNSIPMDNLKNDYSIISENPKYIEKGVIDYREDGIPMLWTEQPELLRTLLHIQEYSFKLTIKMAMLLIIQNLFGRYRNLTTQSEKLPTLTARQVFLLYTETE